MLSKVGSAINYQLTVSETKTAKNSEICSRFIVDSEWIQENVGSMKKQKMEEESSIKI